MLTSPSNRPCIEHLENRVLLALLATYYPLVARAWWLERDRDGDTQKEFIGAKMVRMDGEQVFQRICAPPSDSKSIEYENYGADGAVQLHGFKEGKVLVNFDPPVTLPLETTPGLKSTSSGTVFMGDGRITLDGPYKVVFTVLGPDRVRVPAGTFSTVKVRMNLNMTATFNQSGVKASISMKGTQTKWLAKRIGPVKTVFENTISSNVNGERETKKTASTSALKEYFVPRN